MHKKPELRQREKIARRDRTLARSLLWRAYRQGQAVTLVCAHPNFETLLDALCRWSDPDRPAAGCDLRALGFSSVGLVPLGPQDLADRVGALQRWRKRFERAPGTALSRETRRRHAIWQRSTARINARLTEIHGWLAGARADASPFLLNSATLAECAAAEAELLQGHVLSPHAAACARFVAWMDGASAHRRFLLSLLPHLNVAEVDAERDALTRFLSAVKQLAERRTESRVHLDPRTQQERFNKRFKAYMREAVFSMLVRLFESLEPRWRAAAQIPTPRRGRDFDSVLDRMIANAEARLKILPGAVPTVIAAGLAALCVRDGARSPIPRELLVDAESFTSGRARDRFVALFEASKLKGYERLLRMAPSIGAPIKRNEIPALRRLCRLGGSAEDLRWAIANDASKLYYANIAAGPLREFVEAFSALGGKWEPTAKLIEAVTEMGGTVVLEAFTAWMRRLPAEAGSSNEVLDGIRATVLSCAPAGAIRGPLKGVFSPWVQPPRRLTIPQGLSTGLPAELSLWLGRWAYYRRMAGQPVLLPKSLRKPLSQAAREADERAYLQQTHLATPLSLAAQVRLAALNTRAATGLTALPIEKLTVRLQRLCALAALEAIRHRVQAAAQAHWQKQTGMPAPSLSPQHLLDISVWMRALNPASKSALKELWAAWRTHGPAYRASLPQNQAWLERAAARGVDVQGWLSPPQVSTGCEHGKRFQLEVVRDPCQIFLMGSYFGTCLGVRDGINRNAVLANAMHANKAVLFVRDAETGHVLSRKLVVVSRRFEMIGFRDYGAETACLCNAINNFCLEWARAAKLPLADDGEPEEIDSLFWYNDGSEPWPASMKKSSPAPKVVVTGARLAPALLELKGESIALMRGLDLWKETPDDGIIPRIAGETGLAEEVLAILARRSRSESLASAIAEIASTPGGKLEGETSLALLRGPYDAVKFARNCEKLPGGPGRIARVLAEMNDLDSDRTLACWTWNDRVPTLALLARAAASPSAARAALAELYIGVGGEEPDETITAALALFAERDPDTRPGDSVLRRLVGNVAEYGSGSQCAHPWIAPFAAPEASIGMLAKKWRPDPTPAMLMTLLSNRSAASARTLRAYAEKDNASLVALALYDGRRFQSFIRRRALAMPNRTFAMLALMASDGADAAVRTLAPRAPAAHLASARALYDACMARDFEAIEGHRTALEKIDGGASHECRPLIHSAVDAYWMSVADPSAPIRPLSTQVRHHPKEMLALLLQARGMAAANPARANALREAMDVGISSSAAGAGGLRWAMVLDAMSGGRLLARGGCAIFDRLPTFASVVSLLDAFYPDLNLPPGLLDKPWPLPRADATEEEASFPIEPEMFGRLIRLWVNRSGVDALNAITNATALQREIIALVRAEEEARLAN